jgi:hypothetical protein
MYPKRFKKKGNFIGVIAILNNPVYVIDGTMTYGTPPVSLTVTYLRLFKIAMTPEKLFKNMKKDRQTSLSPYEHKTRDDEVIQQKDLTRDVQVLTSILLSESTHSSVSSLLDISMYIYMVILPI